MSASPDPSDTSTEREDNNAAESDSESAEESAEESEHEHAEPEPDATYERVVERLIDDRALCVWCFAKRRRIYEEYDRARDEYIRNSTLQVVTATSDPDPSTYSEVVPEKKDAERPWVVIEPPRPRCICGDCANIDIDLDKHRSNAMLVKAARNMVTWLNTEHEKGLDETAAANQVRELTSTGRAGKDKLTLASALQHAHEASDDAAEDIMAGLSGHSDDPSA